MLENDHKSELDIYMLNCLLDSAAFNDDSKMVDHLQNYINML